MLIFKKIGSEAHDQIVYVLGDKKASLEKKAVIARFSGELRIKQAIPNLQAIISTEHSLKAELDSLTILRASLYKELGGDKVQDGLLMFGEFALNFAFSVLSGNPANLNTAGQTLKKPRTANGQLTRQKQEQIDRIDKQIKDLNNQIPDLMDSAKKALKRINSGTGEQW